MDNSIDTIDKRTRSQKLQDLGTMINTPKLINTNTIELDDTYLSSRSFCYEIDLKLNDDESSRKVVENINGLRDMVDRLSFRVEDLTRMVNFLMTENEILSNSVIGPKRKLG
jgi:hypothetical protein